MIAGNRRQERLVGERFALRPIESVTGGDQIPEQIVRHEGPRQHMVYRVK